MTGHDRTIQEVQENIEADYYRQNVAVDDANDAIVLLLAHLAAMQQDRDELIERLQRSTEQRAELRDEIIEAEAQLAALQGERDRYRAALMALSNQHEGYVHGVGPCVCAAHIEARKLLALSPVPASKQENKR